MNGTSIPPQRPSSLGIQQAIVTTIVRFSTPVAGVTALVTVRTPSDGPTTVAFSMEHPGTSYEPPLPGWSTTVHPLSGPSTTVLPQPGPSTTAPLLPAPLPPSPTLDQRFFGRTGPRICRQKNPTQNKSLELVPGPSAIPLTSNKDNPSSVADPASTPRSATKRKLEALSLPTKRRRAGPARKAKQLFKYILTPKYFQKKGRKETLYLHIKTNVIVSLSW